MFKKTGERGSFFLPFFHTLIVKIHQELPKLWAFKDDMIFGHFFEFDLTLQRLYLTLFAAINQFKMGTKI